MDRTLVYEAWNRGSNPLGDTKRSFGRLGVCAGLKILRTWFDSTRLHYMVAVVQLVERRNVDPVVAGSSPVRHPNNGSVCAWLKQPPC